MHPKINEKPRLIFEENSVVFQTSEYAKRYTDMSILLKDVIDWEDGARVFEGKDDDAILEPSSLISEENTDTFVLVYDFLDFVYDFGYLFSNKNNLKLFVKILESVGETE